MKEPVLVLNANFAPINICTTRRAIVLILTEKASLVINGRGYIKTVSRSFQRPSIIRLGEMIKRPRQRVSLNRREILRRDHYTCQYCGTQVGTLTLDHVYPKHLGGEHSWENLVTACSACNHLKGGRTLGQVGMRLRSTPREPSVSAEYLFARQTNQNMEWGAFLQGW